MYTALHLEWPACANARDLGGLPIDGGGVVAERALIRTDSLHYLTDEGREALRAYGVSRIIDLRRPVELEQWPNPFATETTYLHCPVENPEDEPIERTLAELYIGMLDRRPALFATAVRAIAEAPPGGVVVHCAAGKDRTGLVVALTLSLVGVADEVIAADYELTNERLRRRYDELTDAAANDAERAYWESVRWAEARNILGALQHLRSRYGGVEAYLEPFGVTSEHIRALRRRLVA